MLNAEQPSPVPQEPPRLRSSLDDLKQESRRIVDKAGQSTIEAADQQKNLACDYLSDVSSAVRKGAEDLKGKGRQGAASFAEWTADELSGLAQEISHRTPNEILSEVQDFARRQPALAAGAAFLIGFGLLRFLKSAPEAGTAAAAPGSRPGPGSHDPYATYHSASEGRGAGDLS